MAAFSAAKSDDGTERLQYQNASAGRKIDGLAAILLLEPLQLFPVLLFIRDDPRFVS
jgi:hypothetical protein